MGGLTGDSRPSEVGGITAMARKVLKVFGNVFKVQLFWTFSCCHIFLSFSDLQLCFTSAYSLWSCCWVFAAGFYSALLPSDVPNALSLSWTSGWVPCFLPLLRNVSSMLYPHPQFVWCHRCHERKKESLWNRWECWRTPEIDTRWDGILVAF